MFNIYEEVTNRILKQLEAGIIPWRKPWQGSQPINYVTRKPYHGVNLLLLDKGGEYLTFLQAKQAGGHVKKGEKSSLIVFFKFIEKENEDGETETKPFLQYSNVFHISQCENVESKLTPIEADENIKPIETAQNILNGYLNRCGVKFENVTGSNRAFYSPANDKITMPVIGQFTSPEEYYSVVYHEASHSTGHATRLNRITDNAAFGSETYSKEELVAEISAAMVMNIAGLEIPQTFENSVAYIQSWSKKLRSDKNLIVAASGKAQKAADLILNVTTA